MKKNWHELSERGKSRRLKKACFIVDDECLTFDFWEAYDRQDFDLARKILKQNNDNGGKIGYHYAKNYDVNDLLA